MRARNKTTMTLIASIAAAGAIAAATLPANAADKGDASSSRVPPRRSLEPPSRANTRRRHLAAPS